MDHDPFKEYSRQTEPDKREKGYIWQTAIGLHYNITKKEWVLDGKTLLYGTASELRATLEKAEQ